ncbi:MAG TPA: 2'-5' RNA ligase family protein [Candidatus Limiplasma sp.]|nr:2'-5' RNA ligase family protein [Candidatus Limiplasma sp.]
MEEKHIYAIAQFDAQTQQRLSALYLQLVNAGFTGTQTKGIPYHITLGTFDVADEALVASRAQAAARNARAFSIRLAFIGLFGLDVLFLAPAVKRQLLDLHQAIVPCGDSADEHPWVAHTTLLMDTPDVIRQAVSVAAQHFIPFRATVESIGVYEFFPEREVGVFPLESV